MDKDLKDRTREFALRIIRLCASVPSNRTNDVIAKQLLRAGTSPGAHFREALRARSKAEYTSKMNGGLMELEETRDFRIAHQQMEGQVRRKHFCFLPSAF